MGAVDYRGRLAKIGLTTVVLLGIGAAGSLRLGRPEIVPVEGGEAVLSSLQVHVAGAVAQPGTYELDANSRIHDAISAAGGTAANADIGSLNMAERLIDGTRIEVPVLGAPRGSAVTGPSGAATISLNMCGQADLETLPGIGPTKARAILAHRSAVGGYRSVNQLLDVKGIGPKTLEKIRPLVRL